MGIKQEVITLHDAIKSALETQYPGHYIKVFENIEDSFVKPAILTTPPVMEVHEMTTKDSFLVTFKCESYVCYSLTVENASILALQYSAYLSRFIHGNNWGLRINSAKVTEAQPAKIDGLDNIVVQCVNWEQTIEITETI